MKNVCATNDPVVVHLRNEPLGISRGIIVDDQYRILYCAVGKVACTNWRRVFLTLSQAQRFPDAKNISATHAHTVKLRQLSDYPWEEQVYRLNTYYKFMFARNPIERLASAYRSKFSYNFPYNRHYHQKYGRLIISRYRQNPSQQSLHEGKDVKFSEFLQFIADPELEAIDKNRHWSHLYTACNPCQVQYDLIGKMETLEQDANHVLRDNHVETLVKFPTREAVNYNNEKTANIISELLSGVPPQLLQRIYQLYKVDFDMFGYKWPIGES